VCFVSKNRNFLDSFIEKVEFNKKKKVTDLPDSKD